MTRNIEAGGLILRLVVGLTFFIHGVAKFQGGIENIAGWFGTLGLPGFLAYIVASIELVGGIALILGLGTRIVSALFIVIMLVAIFTAKLSLGFLGNGQMAGYELDILLMAMSAYLLLNGSTMYSFDSLLSKKSQNKEIPI
ncbi:MAG TPA: hypothetical protein DDY49_04490 [Paenibacillaceae bacterium]|nr:hypothetical protein [Paenibacillaceae bacterium]